MAKPHIVAAVMKENMGMRYRRIKQISMKQNSEQNLLLRQQWALIYMGLDNSKKIILNIDESWLDRMDYRRMKWRPYGSTNSVAKK